MSARTKLIAELMSHANQGDAVFLHRFFKTGPGEYGEGDRFLGLRVPMTRKITKQYATQLSISDLDTMLTNKWHEVRLAALVTMIAQYPKSDNKQALYDLYLSHIGRGINNWDLIDISCPRIVGAYLFERSHQPLYELAKGGLWQKRVSIISTFFFLKYGPDPIDTYQLAELLVNERHDLLQKAVGWSLREMGNLDGALLRKFLDKHAANMPRTALRYSLEKVPDFERRKYMNAKMVQEQS
jgi:3-methyladenine DNA glycosylase AlkD